MAAVTTTQLRTLQPRPYSKNQSPTATGFSGNHPETGKTSFSLPSLHSASPISSPDHVRIRQKTERRYNSLTNKSRRNNKHEQESWRKSLGCVSGSANEDKELWEVFRTDCDLDLMMAQTFIEQTYIRTPDASPDWSFQELREECAQIRSCFNREHDEEERALNKRLAEMEDEISSNTDFQTADLSDDELRAEDNEIEIELRRLRNWIKSVEETLGLVNFHMGWSHSLLDDKTKQLKMLQPDIESHGKLVSSVVRLCEKSVKLDSYSLRLARTLERRYHRLFLRYLEWQCHLESLANRQLNKSPREYRSSSESDCEPAPKLRKRCSGCADNNQQVVKHVTEQLMLDEGVHIDTSCPLDVALHPSPVEVAAANMVDTSALTKHRYESLDSLNSATESILGLEASASLQQTCVKHIESVLDIVLPASVSPLSEALRHDVVQDSIPDDNRSVTKSPNCGMFYFKHLDTDSEQEKVSMSELTDQPDDSIMPNIMPDGIMVGELSSEEEWTFTGSDKPRAAQGLVFEDADKVHNNSTSANDTPCVQISVEISSDELQEKDESIEDLVNRSEHLLRIEPKPVGKQVLGPKTVHSKYSRISEWLKNNRKGDEQLITLQQPVDNCDASGEYTTEDSDELHSQSSEDMDCSVATYRGAGSAEGILDKTPKASSIQTQTPILTQNHTPVLHNRRKPQTVTNRPRSISSFSQIISPSTKTQARDTHSVSESALHQMVFTSPEFVSSGGKGESGGSRDQTPRRRRRVKKRTIQHPSGSGSDGVVTSPCESNPFTSHRNTRGLREVPCEVVEPATAPAVVPSCTKVTREELLSATSLEQVWDNYQEKYLSEAYSEEAPDPDVARRLLDFGDDYRAFFGSNSECSSRGQKRDSESELDELWSLMTQSSSQFDEVADMLNKLLPSTELILATDMTEMITKIHDNIRCLNIRLNKIKEFDGMISIKDCQDVSILLHKWDSLKKKADEIKTASQLQKDIDVIKDEVHLLSSSVDVLKVKVNTKDQLLMRVAEVTKELGEVQNRKPSVLELNISVHRFLNETGHSALNLMEEVSELFCVWDEAFHRISDQLCILQNLVQAWEEFDKSLLELQIELRTDEKILSMLNSALYPDATVEVAEIVRDLAKGLLEKQAVTKMTTLSIDDSSFISIPLLLTPAATEGYLSDSGISDSGNELGMSQRAKSLSDVKLLARYLETTLTLGSQALISMSERIDKAEAESRILQQTCRELFARTASIVDVLRTSGDSLLESPAAIVVPNVVSTASQRLSPGNRRKPRGRGCGMSSPPSDPNPNSGPCTPRKSWFWRIIRSALPFQMVLLAFMYITFLLEPHCCNTLSSFGMSFSSQARCILGPPPV